MRTMHSLLMTAGVVLAFGALYPYQAQAKDPFRLTIQSDPEPKLGKYRIPHMDDPLDDRSGGGKIEYQVSDGVYVGVGRMRLKGGTSGVYRRRSFMGATFSYRPH